MSDDNIVNLQSHDDAELKALYRQAAQPTPPAHLDEAIKRAAYETGSAKRLKAYPWFAGIAISALVGVIFIQLYPTTLPPRLEYFAGEAAKSEADATAEDALRATLQQAPALADRLPGLSTNAAENVLEERSVAAERRQIATPPATAPSSRVDAAQEFDQEKKRMPSSVPAANTATGNSKALQYKAIAAEHEQLSAPQAQLKHILELLEQEKTAEATQAYRAFKQQFPDYLIEAELAQRLEKLL